MDDSESKKIIIFSGAGISAESGISTFRDSDGLWENHKIEDVCYEPTWMQNYALVHKFYNQRRIQLAKVKPNLAHKTVAKIKERYKDDCIVITQNVDDLFERSGIKDVIHLHGELTKMSCLSCKSVWDIGYREWDIKKDCCPKCGSMEDIKPYIVFFAAPAPMYEVMQAKFEHLWNPDSIAVVVGTMGNIVQISSMLSWYKCKKILNNLEFSPYIEEEQFDKIYYQKATTALPKIQKDIEEWF